MKPNWKNINPPIAEKKAEILEKHGDKRQDDYYWLREKENPEVIAYLEAENAYAQKVLAPREDFQQLLFDEMKARIKEEDESVPYYQNEYWYLSRFEKGKEYPIYSRKYQSQENEEQVLFDVNQMAEGLDYYDLGAFQVTYDNQLAFFAFDDVSRRIYTIQFKNLSTGKILEDKLTETTGNAVWAKDNQSLFYVVKDETLRPYRVYKHILGEAQEKDVLVYEEKDNRYTCGVSRSKSREYLFIECSSTDSSEVYYIKANEPDSAFVLFHQREDKLEYSVEHAEDFFYIFTNADLAFNYKLMKTNITQTQKAAWETIIPHREGVLLEGMDVFNDYLVLEERKRGALQIQIIPKNKQKKAYYLPFAEETYTAYTTANRNFDTSLLNYVYTSFTTPREVLSFDMETQKTIVLKKQTVEDPTFDKENYQAKRLWAKARDGEEIPISLVYNKKIQLNKETPLLLYGYGSYGHTIDPSFSSSRLSLLDRGFVFAVAHIRGGEYLGRKWYEDGRLSKKKNTFYDFIDCAEYLIAQSYTSSAHLYAQGGSAGGLLMGAVMNLAPRLFKGIISNVPFVDVVTTMLDETIPLTTGEYDEWGNPNEKEAYEYIKSYSPYDNLENQAFPHLLMTTGLHDSQVQYWEPAKYIAKLRTFTKNTNLVMLKTDMSFGHSGASGRFESLKETALECAFLLSFEEKVID